jgi:hypothetical protein
MAAIEKRGKRCQPRPFHLDKRLQCPQKTDHSTFITGTFKTRAVLTNSKTVFVYRWDGEGAGFGFKGLEDHLSVCHCSPAPCSSKRSLRSGLPECILNMSFPVAIPWNDMVLSVCPAFTEHCLANNGFSLHSAVGWPLSPPMLWLGKLSLRCTN